jgi:hypothetical protein
MQHTLYRDSELFNILNNDKELFIIYENYKKILIIKLDKRLSFQYYKCANFRYYVNKLRNILKTTLHINLSNNKFVVDTCNLSSVNALNLFECKNIYDVSKLGSANKLFIGRCDKITDVSKLEKINTLSLYGCLNIKDISALKNVKNINLTNCKNIKNIDSLINVNILTTHYNKQINYLLHGLKTLCVSIKQNKKYKIKNLPSSICEVIINYESIPDKNIRFYKQKICNK